MTTPADAAERPTRIRWRIFALACGTSWLLYLHRYIFALIKPKLVEEWGIGETELGLLDATFSFSYTAAQIPLGIAADAAGVRIVLTGLLLLGSLGLGLHAWAPSSLQLWYGRVLLGVGQSAVFACLSRITRMWFPQTVRTTVQGWVGVFFGRFGGLSANLLVGSLLLGVFDMPWRTVVWIMAGVGVAHALLFALLFRNGPREHPAVNELEAELIAGGSAETVAAPRMRVREMFRRMSPRSILNLLLLNVQTILSTLADNIYSNWIPLFLFSVHGLHFRELGVYSALPLLGGALGGVAGGWLNDVMIRRLGSRRWARSLVGLGGKGTAGILLLCALWWYDAPRTFCILLFFVKFFSDSSLTTTWGTVTDIGGRTSATVFAWNNTIAGVGSFGGPILYGAVAEHFGWLPVFQLAASAYVLCGISWLAINCTIPVMKEESPRQDG